LGCLEGVFSPGCGTPAYPCHTPYPLAETCCNGSFGLVPGILAAEARAKAGNVPLQALEIPAKPVAGVPAVPCLQELGHFP